MTVPTHTHICAVCDQPYDCDGYVERDDERGRAYCDRYNSTADDCGDWCPTCIAANSDEPPVGAIPGPREKVVQQSIVDLIEAIGGVCYVLGRPSPNDGRTHRGTGQTEGIGDLFAFLPLRAGVTRKRYLWIEAKRRVGGRLLPLRKAQREFMDLCVGAECPHVWGDLDSVIAYLQAGGWVKPDTAAMARTA